MDHEIILPIIGYMKSSYKEKFGIPRQPNLVNSISYVVMRPPYDNLQAFEGIEEFSHLWLLWQFHDNKRKNNSKEFQPLIRPPRLGGNKKIGVFASRSMYRPSPIGLSVVQFVEIKKVNDETRLYVKGADLLDGTPIVDIKPYLAYVDSIAAANSGYAQQAPCQLEVVWSKEAMTKQQVFLQQNKIEHDFILELEEVLSLNPTPAYQRDPEREYGLSLGDFNIKFYVKDDLVLISDLQLQDG